MPENLGLVTVAEEGPSRPCARARFLARVRGAAASRWVDLLAVGGYAVATAVFFWRILGLGMVPVGYDLLTYFYPYKSYLAELVHRGELPLWNPLIFMGAPLLANIQVAALYPLDALFYLLPMADALRYSVVLHLFLAACFTYLFARLSLELSPFGSWIAGAVFAFGGFVGAHVGHLNQLHTAVWLPVLLLCLEQAVARRSARLLALGALAMASQILAGHTQEVYYSGWALGLFAIYLSSRGCVGTRSRLVPFVSLAAMTLGGAAVSAVQLLPTVELARESYRAGGIPLPDAVVFSARPQDLLDAILPLYSAAPYVDVTGYTGVVSLVLLPAATIWRRHTAHWWFVALGVLALSLSLGASTPLYGWLHGWFPGFDLFRAPGRWLFVYSLAVAVVAGVGADSLRASWNGEGPSRLLWRYALGLLAILAALLVVQLWVVTQGDELALPPGRVVLRWATFAAAGVGVSLLLISRPRSKLLAAGLVALLAFELYLAREPLEYNRPADPSMYARPVLSSLMGGDVGAYRMLSLVGDQYPLAGEVALRASLAAGMSGDEIEGYLKLVRLWDGGVPNTGMVLGLASLDGYDGGLLPTRRYAELKQAIFGAGEYHPDLTIRAETRTVPDSRTLGYLGVRYLVLTDGAARYDPGWEEVQQPHRTSLRLLRNQAALPRAYVVHAAQAVADQGQLLDAVRRVDLGQVVLLDEEVGFETLSDPGRDEVTVASDGANEVVLDVSLGSPGILVLSDSFYPGWKVYVDGQETRLLRANHALRAVQLASGSHRVRFAYEPLSFRTGLVVSSLGLAAVGSALLPAHARVGLLALAGQLLSALSYPLLAIGLRLSAAARRLISRRGRL